MTDSSIYVACLVGATTFLLGFLGALWWQGRLDAAEVIMYLGGGIVVGVLISRR